MIELCLVDRKLSFNIWSEGAMAHIIDGCCTNKPHIKFIKW